MLIVNSLKDNKSKILKIISYTDNLRNKINDDEFHFALCQSDIHAGNVLVGENDRIYVIDWDTPILAPKERDLMFI